MESSNGCDGVSFRTEESGDRKAKLERTHTPYPLSETQKQQTRPQCGSCDSTKDTHFDATYESKRVRELDETGEDFQNPAKKHAFNLEHNGSSDPIHVWQPSARENSCIDMDTDEHPGDSNPPAIEESYGEAEAEATWNDIHEKLMMEPKSCLHRQRIERFLVGVQSRETAQNRFEQIFLESRKQFETTLANAMAAAVPVHECIFQKMQGMEKNILRHFVGNHEIRQSIRATLNNDIRECQLKYEKFMARILLDSDSTATEIESKPDINESSPDTCIPNENDSVADPNWDSLIEANPTARDAIQIFLDGRDKWQLAHQNFEAALDEIYQRMKLCHSNSLQGIEDAYTCICDSLEGQQSDIHVLIVSNFQRRARIEHTLEEAAKRQQSLFARLMARVGGAILPSSSS